MFPVLVSQQIINAQKELERRRKLAGTAPYRSPELISPAYFTNAIEEREEIEPHAAETPETPNYTDNSLPETIKTYPALLTAFLKNEVAACGRIYLLLKALDIKGGGCLSEELVRTKLTANHSPIRVCTWRRLRQIFAQGEELFWKRDGRGRIFLASSAKIAQGLDLERFEGLPVELPLAALMGPIKAVRAHFYASFHSGRPSKNPISRQTIRIITGVPERTQRGYDKLAKVTVRQNFAVSKPDSEETRQAQAYRHGTSLFDLVDYRGIQGKTGESYLAWHLPNSYESPHRTCSKRSLRRINRKLVDLVNQGELGNGKSEIERVFWPHGAGAVKGYNQSPENDAYWPLDKRRKKIPWCVVPAQDK